MGPDDSARVAPAEAAESSFDFRRRYSRFFDDDARLLVELHETMETHSAEIVDRFYEHLMGFDRPRAMLADPATVRRLKQVQRAYMLSLTAGRYDDEYARNRLEIGRVHEKIGLTPQWYLGTYGLYVDLLLPMIHERFADEPDKALRAQGALTKLLILDMQTVLDAYYETRERRALRKTEQLAAVGQLAASIAHEVRNPLAGMKGALEVLRDELAVKPANLEIVDELLAQIVRLEQLVRDLLTFASPRVLAPQPFDLQEVLDRLLRQHKETADRSGITIHRAYGPGTSLAVADLQQMEQVFLNLIHNAVQAMEESGGTLTVTTEAREGRLVTTFEDTGGGIPPADLVRIFQPFYTTKHRGSGLGLSIVQKIVEAHEGTIEISSVLGEGTKATLTIPGAAA